MKVFADFNNFDREGYIRLNSPATKAQLDQINLTFHEGLLLTASDGDITADIEVVAPGTEGIWRGKVIGEMRDSS